MMEFLNTVFTWTGILTWYMLFVVAVGKLLKRGRINAFGPDTDDLKADVERFRAYLEEQER